MALKQAEQFAETYTVVDQYNDDTNGLSATVFADAAATKGVSIN